MSELRHNILKQELQKEIDIARQLEAKGDPKAADHYNKAAILYRKLGFITPPQKAEKMFSSAESMEKASGAIESDKPNIDDLIVTQKPDTEWEDIGNLEEAKTTLREAIILPFIKNKPKFVNTTKTILLYGPPGTGKTLLAKASSNTLNATFFEAKASSLLSKYYGESGKLINALFSKARDLQPSLIFMDEIDSIVTSRDHDMSEATRRVIGQLLSEIEGFGTKKDEKVIFIGASNKPWDLDEALISRFQRRVYVPLPDAHGRRIILQIHLKGANLEYSLDELNSKTENFSGRDISNLCREAITNMIREQNPNLQDLSRHQIEKYELKYRPLGKEDFDKAFEKAKPASTKADIEKYNKWAQDFGG